MGSTGNCGHPPSVLDGKAGEKVLAAVCSSFEGIRTEAERRAARLLPGGYGSCLPWGDAR
jgi:hypothetical protein